MAYFLIKDWKVLCVTNKVPKDWIEFDSFIEHDYILNTDYEFEDWKIVLTKIKWRTKEQVLKEIWEMNLQKNWLIEIWISSERIEEILSELKKEYNLFE